MATRVNLSTFKLSDKKKDLSFLARVAETAERYDDMTQFVKALVQEAAGLSVEDRNLLSVAFKNAIGTRRAAWRTLNAEENRGNELINVYKAQLEAEMEAVCKEVLALLDGVLIPSTNNAQNESAVFYLKMAGDYYRYLAEFAEGKGHDASSAAKYEAALTIASSILPPTHPVRLGLVLNYSVCLFEIQKNPGKARDLAKKAFDEAIAKLDQLDEASYKDSTLIMQLLRDNLTLWTSEDQQ